MGFPDEIQESLLFLQEQRAKAICSCKQQYTITGAPLKTRKEQITMKKYELTNETVRHDGRTLHRIKALTSFNDVKAGDLGGFVQSEANLSHTGSAWLYDNAKAYGNAIVTDDAAMYGNAKAYGRAKLHDKAVIYDNVQIHECADMGGEAEAYGNTEIYGNARLYGKTNIAGDITIHKNAKLEDIYISGEAEICG